MAVFGVAITKDLLWRGARQQFSNVYHYNTELGELFDDDAVINALVGHEQAIMAGPINFVKARTWGPTQNLDPVASVTRTIKDLTQAGTLAGTTGMYVEAAQLISWPLGRYGRKNRPQYLRKWLHTLVSHGYNVNGSDPLTSTTPVLDTYIAAVTNLSVNAGAQRYELCTETGRIPIAPARKYKYLEHRQLGR